MTPAFATVIDWTKISGIGRSKTYYLLTTGELRALKVGKRTLIDVQHGLNWLRSLPAAEVNCARARKAAA